MTNPNKPGKVRVVFDCAARYKGTSLNDQLLQGPDQTNSLVGVLTRFRQDKIALVADIEAMFHQVKVSDDDCEALRFLWWPGGNLDKPVKEYCMKVHLFGATSSPSCAGYALRRTADDNAGGFNEDTIHTILRNFYVDDLLKSVENVPRAIELSNQLRNVLSKGGFNLTKWLSNSSKVMESIPAGHRAEQVLNVNFDDKLRLERALGVQ